METSPRTMWSTILVPHDFSPSANHAAALARDEAKRHGCRLILLHVIELPAQIGLDTPVVVHDGTGRPIGVYARSSAEAHIDDLARRLATDGVQVSTVVRIGSPVEEINRFAAEERAGMIVMGTHGRTGIRRLVAGSVTERVVRTSTVPVLTIRHPD